MVPGGPLEWQTLLVTPKYHLLQHHIEKQCFRIFLMRTKRPTGVAQIHGVQCNSARLQVALPVNCSVHVKNSVELWKLCLWAGEVGK